jgi:hypothetical protein
VSQSPKYADSAVKDERHRPFGTKSVIGALFDGPSAKEPLEENQLVSPAGPLLSPSKKKNLGVVESRTPSFQHSKVQIIPPPRQHISEGQLSGCFIPTPVHFPRV